jgi:hypothetical protein
VTSVTGFSDALTIQLEQRATSGAAAPRSLTIRSCKARSESLRIRCQWYMWRGSRSVSWINKWTRSVLRLRTRAKRGAVIAVLACEPTMCEQFEAPIIPLDHDQGFPDLAAVLQKKLIV